MKSKSDMKARFVRRTAHFVIDTRLYSIEVIQKCFYWYTSDFSINFDFLEDGLVEARLVLISGEDIDEISLNAKVSKDLNDHMLRAIVSKETGTIRELLVAKAFANFEEEEPTFSMEDVSDPIGFKL
jgi:His-Xaa-Ser system protein HxsD